MRLIVLSGCLWLLQAGMGWADCGVYHIPSTGEVLGWTCSRKHPINVEFEVSSGYPAGTGGLRVLSLPEQPRATRYKVVNEIVTLESVPTPLDPNAELETAITNSTTLQELKDALVGKRGKGKVVGRTP